MDFDEDRIYYSYQNLQPTIEDDTGQQQQQHIDDDNFESDDIDLNAVKRHFREFLRNYRQSQRYLYRDRLLRMYQRTSIDDRLLQHNTNNSNSNNAANKNVSSSSPPNNASITVDIAHLGEYDPAVLDLLLHQPTLVLPPFEVAAAEALKSLLRERAQDSPNQENGDDDDQVMMEQPQGQTQDGNENEFANPNQRISSSSKNNFQFHGSSIQILFKGRLTPTPLRSIQSHHMNTLIRCTGIVISASKVRSRASSVYIRCSKCKNTQTIHSSGGPFASIPLPHKCKINANECGPSPYTVVPDDSRFVDQQTLKLQECPEAVPTGEMPRSTLLAVERGLVDKAPPGTRVSVLAIVSLFNSNGGGNGSNSVKTVYLRVVGLDRDSGAGDLVTFTPREEEAFRLLSRRSDVYHILSRSIAPSISGSYTHDIKKAITCQLFSGSRKRLPDGMRLRGDINILLLGDPSMAKSQFLKYTTKVAPVGVYTSGKGSSAAGLTASVVKDQRGEFYLEGGAMVLADGGIVAIDEFDKMRPADRVAIHEAMEQQTISIAKAGITTVLNSRSSVLAAANPVFGRYDDMKSASENIDLMTTILSRFDLIFLVRDVRDEELDNMICHHVMGVHMSSSRSNVSAGNSAFGVSLSSLGPDGGAFESGLGELPDEANSSAESIAENAMRVASTGNGELDVPTMKKYIQYCKAKCSPRLTEEAGDILASSYVKIRDDVRRTAMEVNMDRNSESDDSQAAIPITVRQLEALIRISESLAKMRLDDEVQSEDITEALRLFKVSTMAANAADSAASNLISKSVPPGGQAPRLGLMPSREEILRTESFLRSRMGIGSIMNKQRIVEEGASQGYDATVLSRVIAIMIMRGEVQELNQGRLFKRVK